MTQSDFDRGVAAERERIRSIFSHELAAELPADAIKMALETSIDPVVAGFRLNREASKPEGDRSGVEIFDRERTTPTGMSSTTSTTLDPNDPHGWGSIADKLNAETNAKTKPQTTQAGSFSTDELVERMNAGQA